MLSHIWEWAQKELFLEWVIYHKQIQVSMSIEVERKKALTINIPDKLQQTDRYYLHWVSRTHNLAVYQNILGVWIQNDPYKKI